MIKKSRHSSIWIMLFALCSIITPLFGQSDLTIASRLRFGTADADTDGAKAVFGLDAGAGKSFIFHNYHNAKKLMVINGTSGNVGIGIETPQAKLVVDGNILAKEVKVQTNIAVPDYVFEPDYELAPLAEVEAYVKEHKHLPEIPSAKDIERDGLNLAEMNLLLLKKVEELTLHLIEKEKGEHRQGQRIEQLEKLLSGLIGKRNAEDGPDPANETK